MRATTRRFTPTRVGNTAADSRTLPRRRFTPTRVGKTNVRSQSADRLPRFTPTRVGNTFYHGARPQRLTVHPHARGEYSVD